MAVSKLDLQGCKLKFIYDITGGWDSVLFLGPDVPVFESQQGQDDVILFLHMSRLALGLTQFPIEWLPEILFWGVKQLDMMFNTDLHLGPSLRMSGSIPPLTLYVFIA